MNTPPGPTGPRDALREMDQRITAELLARWRALNHDRFDARMKPPVIQLRIDLGRRAAWSRPGRGLVLHAVFARTAPWAQVLDAFTQQVVHQFVDEVRGALAEPAHTAVYLRECERLGLSAGLDRAEELGDEARRALRRVMQLIALSESPNRHEAEAAMQEAQRLMLKYNLKVTPLAPAAGTPYDSRCLGEHKRRFTGSERAVGRLLSRHFFVCSFWRWLHDPRSGKRGWVLEISGTPANLEIASYVFDFLHRTADRLWQAHKRERGIRGDRERRDFLTGVIEGFGARLDEQRRRDRSEGLVWLGDAGLRQYKDRRHPSQRTIKARLRPWTAIQAEGFSAGREIVLHVPVGPETRTGPAPALPAP